MTQQLQAKLLRVTQDGRFQRVGSNREIRTNARILAASNRNLEEEVKNNRFREDLFYRLNVVELNVPPLRERREDILPLASLFITEFAKGRARFSETVTACLEGYSWPGNVRELRNAMERAVLLSRSELILPEHLPARVRDAAGRPGTSPDPPTPSNSKKSSAKPSSRRFETTTSTAPKPPKPSASAAAPSSTSSSTSKSSATKSTQLDALFWLKSATNPRRTLKRSRAERRG